MKFRKKIKDRLKNRHGIKKEVFPILQNLLADYICGISRNSSYFLLGVYDITTENFYNHDVFKYIRKITETYELMDYYECFKPFMSNKFFKINESNKHKILIAELFRYYLLRFYPLVTYSSFSSWHNKTGPNTEDIDKIIAYSLEYFRKQYPVLGETLFINGPEDEDSIYYQNAVVKEMTLSHNYEDEQIQQYIYKEHRVWDVFVENFLKENDNNNIYFFISQIFHQYINIFWDDYRSRYIDMLRLWSMEGAFEGHGTYYEQLWTSRAECIKNNISI